MSILCLGDSALTVGNRISDLPGRAGVGVTFSERDSEHSMP